MAKVADFLELVRDVEDRSSLGREFSQRREEDFRFLRRENRSRLVHDKKLRLLEKATNIRPVTPRRRDHLLAPGLMETVIGAVPLIRSAEAASRGGEHAESDVLAPREGIEEREMLKDMACRARAAFVLPCMDSPLNSCQPESGRRFRRSSSPAWLPEAVSREAWISPAPRKATPSFAWTPEPLKVH